MLDGFLRYINEKALFSTSDRLLLAVSGGIDSIVLVNLCHQAGFNFGIAHCNFKLRGKESDGDAAFVASLAQQLKVDFYCTDFETQAFATQQGISIQMAARDLRYNWFDEIRQQYHYDYILTAHHQDDLLETILMNITRGTGLAGLHGILPKHNFLVRPLLFANRNTIEEFVHQHNLTWREDSSNESHYYIRNKLRHEVLPILRTINPHVSAAATQLAERVAAHEHILEEVFRSTASEVIQKQDDLIRIEIDKIDQLKEPIEFLSHYIAPYGFDYNQAKKIWQNKNRQTGQQYFSGTHRITLDRHHWIIDSPTQFIASQYIDSEQASFIELPYITLSWEKINLIPLSFPTNSHTVYIDADLLKYPLVVRQWQTGDWFYPFGMNGKKKKISDVLIDNKVPLALKNKVYVLESDGKIVWLIGIRLDNRFKITQTTKNALKFYFNTKP